MFTNCSYDGRNDRRRPHPRLARIGPLRLWPRGRHIVAIEPPLPLPSRPGFGNAGVDARPGIPTRPLGEPAQMPAVWFPKHRCAIRAAIDRGAREGHVRRHQVPKKYPAAKNPNGPVAQGIEQQPSKLKVPGSNPGGVANYRVRPTSRLPFCRHRSGAGAAVRFRRTKAALAM